MNLFRFISLLIVVVLSIPGSACEPSPSCPFTVQTKSSSAVPEGFGVNIHFTEPRPGELKMLSEAGFRWVRMDLKWDATERERGVYDFSEYDHLVAELDRYKLQALFILDYGNPLYDDGAPPRTEPTRQAFARWAVAVAKHFAGRKILWEIYNEPNHSLFWPPKPNTQEYAQLALTVARAFRAALPDEKLIGPATSEIDFAFVETCFKAGLLEYWSAVSIHPYRRTNPESAAQDYCRLRELIKSYAPTRNIPIISSEWGYSSAWPSLDPQKQGELLARSWLTNLANGIPLSIWYDWRDDGEQLNEPEHHFGVVANRYFDAREPVYDQKPAYQAAKTFSTFFNGHHFERQLDAGSTDVYLLVFRKGNELRYAAWTTGPSMEISIPLSAGSYAGTGLTGNELGIFNADTKGLRINLSTAPVYFRTAR